LWKDVPGMLASPMINACDCESSMENEKYLSNVRSRTTPSDFSFYETLTQARTAK
jgi:hypothetical protein